MLLERDSQGDSAKATSQLAETLAIFSELGMQPLGPEGDSERGVKALKVISEGAVT